MVILIPSVKLPGKQFLVAKERGRISSIGLSSFIPVRLIQIPRPKGRSPQERAFRESELKNFRAKGRSKKELESRMGVDLQARQIVRGITGRRVTADLYHGSFKGNRLAATGLSRMPETDLLKLVRGNFFLKGKTTNLYSMAEHTLATGAGILLAGNEKQRYKLIIPTRARNVTGYPEHIHVYSGRINVGEKLHEGALREVHEETGIPKNRISFLGEGLKKVRNEQAQPFVVTTSLSQATSDALYVMNLRGDPEEVVNEFFKKSSDGGYKPRNAEDAWEHKRIDIIDCTSENLQAFMDEHGEKITPIARMTLRAFKHYLDSIKR